MKKHLPVVLLSLFFYAGAEAQVVVRGRVLDKSKINLVENVLVMSTTGARTFSDSLGRYHIAVSPADSLYFVYDGKATQRYAVKTIPDINQFEIAIQKTIPGKYTTLKEVIVTTKSFRQDSIENREHFAKIFDYEKPGAYLSMSPEGNAGLDLDQLINLFRFKRNRRMRSFQNFMVTVEQEKYVTHRFSHDYVKRLTGLQAPQLDSFVKWYRPDYELLTQMSEWQLGEYTLEAFKQYKKLLPVSAVLPKEN